MSICLKENESEEEEIHLRSICFSFIVICIGFFSILQISSSIISSIMAAMNRGAAICGVFAILMTCLIAVPMYFKLRNRFVQTNKSKFIRFMFSKTIMKNFIDATSSRHTTDDFLTGMVMNFEYMFMI